MVFHLTSRPETSWGRGKGVDQSSNIDVQGGDITNDASEMLNKNHRNYTWNLFEQWYILHINQGFIHQPCSRNIQLEEVYLFFSMWWLPN